GNQRSTDLAYCYPHGRGRGHFNGVDLAAVFGDSGTEGLRDPHGPQIPDTAAARQGALCAVQDAGQGVHAGGHPAADFVSETAFYTRSCLARPPARYLSQSPQAYRPAGFVLSVPVRIGRTAPQAAAPQLR